jgi:signal transduction histidine kinase
MTNPLRRLRNLLRGPHLVGPGRTRSLYLAAVGIAVVFWLFDSAVDAFVFQVSSFMESVLTVDPAELWMRLIVVALIIGFAFYAERTLTKLREAERAVRQAQKLEAVGRLAGGVAHDFNNLLTVIHTNADLVAEGLPVESRHLKPDVEEIQHSALRGAALIRRLLSFSRPEAIETGAIDLNQLVGGLQDTLRRLLPETIDLEVQPDHSDPVIEADAAAVEQIVVNLATNARDAMAGGGTLRIGTERGSPLRDRQSGGRPDTDYVCLSVSDTGVGMDVQTKEKIFEPFFTTKPQGEGTGLGLWTTYNLLREHGGWVDVLSVPDRGTTVNLYFPGTKRAMAATDAAGETSRPEGGTETILLVDDDEGLCRATKRVLGRYGYEVFVATDGGEALDIFREHREDVALVISDIVMPRVSGSDLYKSIQGEAPGTKFLFVSGYAPDDLGERLENHPGALFLAKPWTIPELLTRVREVLAKGSAS